MYETQKPFPCRQMHAKRVLGYCYISYCYICLETGVSANAIPHTNKLRTRVTHIWGYRRRQPSRGAMEGPLPGETACMITVFSVPGKYARQRWPLFLYTPMNTISLCRRDTPMYPRGHRARHRSVPVQLLCRYMCTFDVICVIIGAKSRFL